MVARLVAPLRRSTRGNLPATTRAHFLGSYPETHLLVPAARVAADLSFGLPVATLPGIFPQTTTEIMAQELRRAKNATTSPLRYWEFGDGF